MDETTWQERADEALAHNIADVMERGPGLRTSRKTAALAIDRANNRVLKTGLGSMGVGTMWCRYDTEDPEWADVPEESSIGGKVGEVCSHPEGGSDLGDYGDGRRHLFCRTCCASWTED